MAWVGLAGLCGVPLLWERWRRLTASAAGPASAATVASPSSLPSAPTAAPASGPGSGAHSLADLGEADSGLELNLAAIKGTGAGKGGAAKDKLEAIKAGATANRKDPQYMTLTGLHDADIFGK